jgi:hypothetical protein
VNVFLYELQSANALPPERTRATMVNRTLVMKLQQLGAEQVVDGFELCPSCDGMSPVSRWTARPLCIARFVTIRTR